MKQVKFLLFTLVLLVSASANAQTAKSFYKSLLEEFCVSYYDEGFSPKQYIEGSLTVTTVEPVESSDVIKVKGKHSYRGAYIPLFGRKTHSNVAFKAEVKKVTSGFNVKFWKWYEPDINDPNGHWEGPIERTFIP